MLQSRLSLVDLIGRCGIDAPVESENTAWVVGLQALGLRCGGQYQKLSGGARKVDQQRDGSLLRTENGPIGGASMLQASPDDIFGMMGLIRLRDQATTATELSRKRFG